MMNETHPLYLDGFDLSENGLIYGSKILQRGMTLQARMQLVKTMTANFQHITNAARDYRASAKLYGKCYRYKGRNGEYRKAVPEKEIARGLFLIGDSKKFHLQRCGATDIGGVVDYETPLFHTRTCDMPRRIDMISIKHEGEGELFIIELKAPDAPDHLSRCLLEAYTYSIFAGRDKLRRDYNVGRNAKIILCPMIFTGSTAGQDYEMMTKGKCPELVDLIKMIERDNDLAVRFAILSREDSPAFISDPKGIPFNNVWWQGTR